MPVRFRGPPPSITRYKYGGGREEGGREGGRKEDGLARSNGEKVSITPLPSNPSLPPSIPSSASI